MSRISARFRWIAGTRMCEGKSSSSWMISSARSVSTAWMPSAARLALRSISSVAIDFTFTTSSTPCDRAIEATIEHASLPSFAQCTVPPAACTDASSVSSVASSRSSAASLIAAPASRSSSQSGTSSTARPRLSRIVEVARARFARS